jgi:hypothetical protein
LRYNNKRINLFKPLDRFSLGRAAHFNFRGRRSLSQFKRQLRLTPDSDWPPRLRKTWKLLTAELSLPREKALWVLIQSLEPALRCVKAQNQLLNRHEKTSARERLRRVCLRVRNGIKRGPAALRRRLDQELGELIQEPIIDLETIEVIFEKAAAAFEEWSDDKTTAAASKAIRGWRTTLIAALSAEARAAAEKALGEVAAKATAGDPVAIEIFGTLGQTLKHNKNANQSKQIQGIITTYVVDIAELWRQAGLRPARAYSESDPRYFSRFHWFADDVLATVEDSSAERGEGPSRVYHHDLRAALQRNSDDGETV